ncbi:hypothetical protein Syun_006204 [Stephania yunnanensis]|uniref:Uncharacterized protein n=1 Tax=Stephania yunnanensis TaxID=152371 RepID=A0AAP0PXC2_9MAGN
MVSFIGVKMDSCRTQSTFNPKKFSNGTIDFECVADVSGNQSRGCLLQCLLLDIVVDILSTTTSSLFVIELNKKQKNGLILCKNKIKSQKKFQSMV